MLLADTSSIQSFNLFAICGLQRAKDPNVTGLELMGDVRWYAAKDNMVFKPILQGFEWFVCLKLVINENL